MRPLLRVVIVTAVVVILLPIVAFVAYDLISFESEREKIHQLAVSGTSDEQSPPELVVNLLHVAYPEPSSLALLASRILVVQIKDTPHHLNAMQWHVTGALWLALVRLHLSEQEQIALIASRSYVGAQQHGLSVAAGSLFHQPLPALNSAEAATVVALPHAPSYYSRHPEVLAERRDLLLARLKGSSK